MAKPGWRGYIRWVELDELDLAILGALRENARATHAAIGREIGITGPAVYARVRRMEEGGVILGYRPIVEPSAIGQGLTAIVRVVTRPTPTEVDFEEFILRDRRVFECFDVDGEDSFILKVRCRNPKELQEFLRQIRTMPVVVRTISNIVLNAVKEEI